MGDLCPKCQFGKVRCIFDTVNGELICKCKHCGYEAKKEEV